MKSKTKSSLILLGEVFFIGCFLFLPFARAGAAETDCQGCHGMKELEKAGKKGEKISLYVNPQDLKNSVHGSLDCQTCHPQAGEVPHPQMKPVDCNQCHPQTITEALEKSVHGTSGVKVACTQCHGSHTIKAAGKDPFLACQNCHRQSASQFKNSVHERAVSAGKSEAASCDDCHGGHGIRKIKDPASAVYPLNLPRTCAKCHGTPKKAGGKTLPGGNIYQLYMDSIHGRALNREGLLVAAVCTSCHGAHGIRSHDDPASATNQRNIAKTCGKCHAGIEAVYSGSIHGRQLQKGNVNAPSCADCHSAHQIRRVESTTFRQGIVQECGTCHVQSLKTFRDTFHGQSTTLGLIRSARCSDCHGDHNVLPSSDPKSMTNRAHLLTTCQKCHPEATPKFTEYYPHADPAKKEEYPLLHQTYWFMTILLLGTFGFFGLHTILWLPRALRERLNHQKSRTLAGSHDPSPGPGGEGENSKGSKA